MPKITVITRKAYGGAYVVMNSKAIGADFVFAWPTAEIAVMGAEAAVPLLFRREIAAADDADELRAELIADYKEQFASPYQAASRGYVDDIIEPAETRKHLIRALALVETKRVSRAEAASTGTSRCERLPIRRIEPTEEDVAAIVAVLFGRYRLNSRVQRRGHAARLELRGADGEVYGI